MKQIREPLTFKPLYKEYLWGGSRIASLYKRTGTPRVCAESWELAAHADGDSIVAAGSFAGKRLSALATEYGAALCGSAAPRKGEFPLLIKVIDAQRDLSVQVHPNNDNAALTGGDPKTEAWVALDCAPGARLYAGLKAGTNAGKLRAALAEGRAAEMLGALPLARGQALLIPGGLVHAIGAGCMIYEVQQNSNTTYRLYDWDRKDASGQPRQLHLEESFKSIDWSLPVPNLIESGGKDSTPDAAARWHELVRSAYFRVRQLELGAPLKAEMDGTTFQALFVVAGQVCITAGGVSATLATGSSALLPADAGVYALTPGNKATLLVTTLV